MSNPIPTVIDLSHSQNPFNLAPAVAAGINYFDVKASEGLGYKDPHYDKHVVNVRAVRAALGAYHFANGRHSGKDQANWFMDCCEADQPLSLTLDLETPPGGPPMTLAQAEEFAETVIARSNGWSNFRQIYGGAYLRSLKVPKSSILAQWHLWLAAYIPVPQMIPPWDAPLIWQYTDGVHGLEPRRLPGVPEVDLSCEWTPGALAAVWGSAKP